MFVYILNISFAETVPRAITILFVPTSCLRRRSWLAFATPTERLHRTCLPYTCKKGDYLVANFGPETSLDNPAKKCAGTVHVYNQFTYIMRQTEITTSNLWQFKWT